MYILTFMNISFDGSPKKPSVLFVMVIVVGNGYGDPSSIPGYAVYILHPDNNGDIIG